MSTISISVKTRAKIHTLALKDPQALDRALKTATRKSAVYVQGQARQEAPVDTGILRSRIKFDTVNGGHGARVYPNSNYAQWVHEGRSPGKMPPWREGSNLARWAKRRGISPYLVARSIARKGTKGDPFMARAFESSKQPVRRFYDREVSRALRRV